MKLCYSISRSKATDYTAAVTALNDHFLPKVNALFPHQKHRLQQKEGETVLHFVTRLRKEGKDCNFGADFDNQLRDAVLCKCRSDYERRKLLEEKEELTLARTLPLKEHCETVEHQVSSTNMRYLPLWQECRESTISLTTLLYMVQTRQLMTSAFTKLWNI